MPSQAELGKEKKSELIILIQEIKVFDVIDEV